MKDLGAFMERQMSMCVLTLSYLDLGELFVLGVTHVTYLGADEYTH